MFLLQILRSHSLFADVVAQALKETGHHPRKE